MKEYKIKENKAMKKTVNKTTRIGREYVNILGINIVSSELVELLTGVKEKISHSHTRGYDQKFSIFTPNPEIVLMAQSNKQLREAINSADFTVPDGVGLAYASKFLYGENLNIIPGRKLFDELIKLAVKEGWKVFLLGGIGDEAELACKNLISLYPDILITFNKGPKLDQLANPVTQVDIKLQSDVVNKINKLEPDLLFVAFGNPKQEIWIYKNLPKLKIGGAMAVGGTFRYIAGLSKLPPKWMEKAGLEWLWRLITEPNRLKRVFNAFPIFPLKIFWYKITHL